MRIVLEFAFVLNTSAKKALVLVKIIKDFFYILYMLVKRLFLLVDAYAVLFVINFGAKVFQFEYIFRRIDNFENFFYMFGFRVIFGFLLLLIYDLIKHDLFELEIKTLEARKIRREQDSFLKTIYNKVPWLNILFQNIKIFITESKYYKHLITRKWLQTFITYYKRAIWIKIIINLIIFIFVNLVDPIIEIIRSRPGDNEYRGMVNLTIFRNYIIGSFLCSTALYATFSILHKVVLF